MTPRTSLSGLGLTALCPGSASLPRVASVGPAAAFGNATHEMLSRRGGGYNDHSDFDVARLVATWDLADSQAADLAFLARSLRLPVPAGALAEVPLGYFADGSVRRVVGARGEYEDAPGLLLPGTIDAMWAEPEPLRVQWCCPPGSTLWVVDFKVPTPRMQAEEGGSHSVEPIARNWQLRAGALLAARWTGATRVIPAICYVTVEGARAAARKGRAYEGEWEVGAPLGVTELQDIERDVRAVLAAAGIGGEDAADSSHVLVLRDGQEDGGSLRESGRAVLGRTGEDLLGVPARGDRRAPRFVTGPHCDRCDRAAACPAWGRLVLGVLGSGEVRAAPHLSALTPSERPHVLAAMLAARRFADAAERMLRAGGQVALPGGREYGPALEERRELDPGAALDVLAEVVGEDAALAAAEVSFASVKRALEGADKDTRARVWARLEELGAIKVTHAERWRVRMVKEARSDAGSDDTGREDRGKAGQERREAADTGGRGHDLAVGPDVLLGGAARGDRDAERDGACEVVGPGERGEDAPSDAGAGRRDAVLTEGMTHGESDNRGSARGPGGSGGSGGEAGRDALPGAPGGGGAAPEDAPGRDDRAHGADGDRGRDGGAVRARGLCASCGAEYSVTAKGLPRKHTATGGSYCPGNTLSARPLPAQTAIPV